MLLIAIHHVGATFGCDSSPYYYPNPLDRGWKAAPTGESLSSFFFLLSLVLYLLSSVLCQLFAVLCISLCAMLYALCAISAFQIALKITRCVRPLRLLEQLPG
jgi:uncharacterized membrane protein YciS (DUF1049 family)